ncbi:TetR/AcrR family transcriptional regulator [Paenarthrobacter nitroguajacolicus]|uniref:TetR/AcrR family transcriptional regulator n=1 Tax=Paenarthrobacter nitroguajacolicus TaxID=211146 RepID=A0A558H706_PAENT|nr:TetR/AcrR family transcriptional regulator [Paenarthrobacter nitroguajacolicus]TVU64861.1 TetR/AcrR family transcriptional regulator [Paenarthrobacter nitroguajacolicus]
MTVDPIAPLRQRPAGNVGRTRDLGRDTKILDAALDLVSEQGRGAVSMEAIAARAGVSKSTVYRRWGNLADLLADAVDTITFASAPAATGNVRDDLVEGIIAASGCMDPRRQRIISALLSTGIDQAELVEALRIRFIDATAAAMKVAVQEQTDTEWPKASIELAVVIGLLTGLPHITGHPIDRADFERIVDDALLPLLAHRSC